MVFKISTVEIWHSANSRYSENSFVKEKNYCILCSQSSCCIYWKTHNSYRTCWQHLKNNFKVKLQGSDSHSLENRSVVSISSSISSFGDSSWLTVQICCMVLVATALRMRTTFVVHYHIGFQDIEWKINLLFKNTTSFFSQFIFVLLFEWFYNFDFIFLMRTTKQQKIREVRFGPLNRIVGA